MMRRPPRAMRTDPLVPYATLVRSAVLGGRVLIFGRMSGDLVRIGVAGTDAIAAIVAPAFGIADADGDRFDLPDRFLLRFGRHPVDAVHTASKRRLDPLHHVADFGFGGAGKIFPRIDAADRAAALRVPSIARAPVPAALLTCAPPR